MEKEIIKVSPIVNWYFQINGAIIICPKCEKSETKIEYPRSFDKQAIIEGITYGHRFIEFKCIKCNTIVEVNNFD